jgi:hypothetical protein
MRLKIFALSLAAAGICLVAEARPAADSAQRAMNGLTAAVKKNNVKSVCRYIPKSGVKFKDNFASPPTSEMWKPGTKDGRDNITTYLITSYGDVDYGLGDSLREDKWIKIGPDRFTFKGSRAKVIYIQWKKNAGRWLISEIGYPRSAS